MDFRYSFMPNYTPNDIYLLRSFPFLVETSGYKFLFHPFITPNELAASIDIETIEADFILISHGHSDHVADANSIAKLTGAKVICGWKVMAWFNKNGIENVHPINIGGASAFDFGKVKCTVAQHSSTMPDGSNGGNQMGFIISTGEKTFYYSGDTGCWLCKGYKSDRCALRHIWVDKD